MTRNFTFYITFILSFTNFLVFYSYPFLLETLGVVDGFAGIIVAVATVLTLGARIITGFFLDNKLPKNSLLYAHIIYIFSFTLLHSPMIGLVFMGRILIGASLGITATLLLYYSIVGESTAKGKAKSVSLMTFFGVLPTCLAPVAAIQLKSYFGVTAVTTIAICMLSISLVLSYFVDNDISKKTIHRESNRRIISDFLSIINRIEIKLVIVLLMLSYVISGTTVTFLPKFFEENGIGLVSWYFLAFSLSMVLPRFILKNKMPDGSRFPIVIFISCALMGLVGNLINMSLTETHFILLGAALNGATLGIIYPAVMAFTVCSVDTRVTGSVSSLVASAADCGVFLANLLIGVVSLKFGTKIALLIPVVTSTICILLIVTYFAKHSSVLSKNLVKGSVK